MSSTHYAHMDEPLVISSHSDEDTSSTSTPTSSLSSSPVLVHFKLHSRRYAVGFLLFFTFLIGLSIGAAVFSHHSTAPAVVDIPSTGAVSTASVAPTGAAGTATPLAPTTPGQTTGGAPVGPSGGGRPSGGPGPQGSTGSPFVALTSATSTYNPFAPSCSNTTSIIEEGPYFVDEKILSNDLYTTSPGVPLSLTFALYNTSATQCMPVSNAWVDIWEADFKGKYSDESSEGTKGLTYLRGYQVTAKNGTVTFRTTYPGYYDGRTVHLHVMVRTWDAAGNQLYRSTTQLYFDDSISDAVFALAPYNTRPARKTRNPQDRIFSQKAMLPLQGDVKSGYSAAFPLVVPFVR